MIIRIQLILIVCCFLLTEKVLSKSIKGHTNKIIGLYHAPAKHVNGNVTYPSNITTLQGHNLVRLSFGKEFIVSVFPNPTDRELYITSNLSVNKFEAFSVSGAPIPIKLIDDTANYFQLDISFWPKGVYMLYAYTDVKVWKWKVLVE